MTREEVKKKLQSFREAQRRLEIAERELEEFGSRLTPPIDYSKPRVGGSNTSDMGDIVAKLSEMHDKIHKEFIEASNQLLEVKEMLNGVKDVREREILSRRYISCQHWDTISYEMRLDRRWIFRLHDRALDEIADDISKTDKENNKAMGKGVRLN